MPGDYFVLMIKRAPGIRSNPLAAEALVNVGGAAPDLTGITAVFDEPNGKSAATRTPLSRQIP